ncbi:MAG: Na+/H+ antiporter NhaC family protein [Nannocystaceae bacterium]
MGWLSLAPPLLAIVLAIATRQVYLSLFAGIWLGCTLLAGGNPIVGLADGLDACVAVFEDAGNTKVVLFSALVGALIALGQASGGVEGFVVWVTRGGLVNSARRARLLSWTLGVLIFVESSITALVNGGVCRPIFDRFKIPREKLAYLCDATSAPICLLIPLNAWGAYVVQLLAAEGVDDPVATLVSSLAYSFYPMAALALSLYIAWSGRDFGPMLVAERRARETGQVLRPGAEPMVGKEVTALGPLPNARREARDFVIPVVVMVLMMPIGLYITGDGSLADGSGSTSVFWAVLAATSTAALMMLGRGQASLRELTDVAFTGIGGLVPLAVLMVLAFAIGHVARDLETGRFVAQLAQNRIPTACLPVVTFGLGCFIAFSTGTSWGTFALMIPIAVPLAEALPEANVALYVGAALSGGVFGDHCSPISDTSVISSMASGSDHIDHVMTQLPYAVAAGAVAIVAYLLVGIVG